MKELNKKDQKILREVKSINDVRFISNRIDYISCAYLYLAKYGLHKYAMRYPSLSSTYNTKELIFYLKALQQRKEVLMRLRELDEEKYRKLGLI